MRKYNITNEAFQSAEIPWEELCDIYEDFSNIKHKLYENILDEFFGTYLKNPNKFREKEGVKIHSIRYRVKDAEHLLAKIIRKKQENNHKYKNMDKTNYEKFVTDLIGIRCLVLFKIDWQSLHRYIISLFENNADYYIKDSVLDFDDDVDHYYIAEPPKVHIRNGDERDIYDELLPPDSVLDGKVYRSVHYIIKYKGVYIELQVRTLFEEGWGEINHEIVYPYFQENEVLKEYTELLNRLSGLADEMGSFFQRLKKIEIEKSEEYKINDEDTLKTKTETAVLNNMNPEEKFKDASWSLNTPRECLQSVCDE